MKNLIYLFLAGALAFGSCGKDDTDDRAIEVGSVRLDKTALTLDIGATYTLTATVEPENAGNKTVVWESNASDVATVSDAGLVTAVASGTATITAKAGGKSATCTVTVERPVDGIKLDKTALTLDVGATYTLTATVEPENADNQTVVWTSDKEGIAKVSEAGVVTGVAPGEATITATADGKSATCTVTVERRVESVTLNKTQIALKRVETFTLVAAIAPEDASDKTVAWTSLDEGIATVSEAGVVTGVALGTTTITAMVDGKSATCRVTVEPDIYVLGTDLTQDMQTRKGVLWINGKVAEAIPFRDPNAVYVSDGVVYAAGGWYNQQNEWSNGIWKDGKVEQWGESQTRDIYHFRSVCVNGQDVYVGSEGVGPTVWINGEPLKMTASNRGAVNSVCFSDGTLYMGGIRQVIGFTEKQALRAIYWTLEKGTTAYVTNDLTDGTIDAGAYSIAVAKDDIYLVGYEASGPEGRYEARIWKNGVKSPLQGGYLGRGVAVSEKGDVYVCGMDSDNMYPVLWKNGEISQLESPVPGYAYAISVYGDDVYVVGFVGREAVLWKNGKKEVLPGGAVATSICIY